MPPSVTNVTTQADIDREIEELRATGGPQPRLDYPPYRRSTLRHPTRTPVPADPRMT